MPSAGNLYHDSRQPSYIAGDYVSGHEMVPCRQACGSLVRRDSKTLLCQRCYTERRRAHLADKPIPLSEVDLLDRADFAYRLARRGEQDSLGLLAAVVWPTV